MRNGPVSYKYHSAVGVAFLCYAFMVTEGVVTIACFTSSISIVWWVYFVRHFYSCFSNVEMNVRDECTCVSVCECVCVCVRERERERERESMQQRNLEFYTVLEVKSASLGLLLFYHGVKQNVAAYICHHAEPCYPAEIRASAGRTK